MRKLLFILAFLPFVSFAQYDDGIQPFPDLGMTKIQILDSVHFDFMVIDGVDSVCVKFVNGRMVAVNCQEGGSNVSDSLITGADYDTTTNTLTLFRDAGNINVFIPTGTGGGGAAAWGSIGGDISEQADLIALLSDYVLVSDTNLMLDPYLRKTVANDTTAVIRSDLTALDTTAIKYTDPKINYKYSGFETPEYEVNIKGAIRGRYREVRPIVTIIADDGRVDDLDWLRPIADPYGVNICHALVSDWLLTPPSAEYLSYTDLPELVSNGDEIIAHTKSHADLLTLDSTQLYDELGDHKRVMDSLGYPVTSVVAPFGRTDKEVRDMMRRFYTSNFVTRGFFINTPPINSYHVTRFDLDNLSIDSAKKAVDVAVANNSWLVFVIHPGYAKWDDTLNQSGIDSLLSYMVDTVNIEVKTVSEALKIFANTYEQGDREYDQNVITSPQHFAVGSDGTPSIKSAEGAAFLAEDQTFSGLNSFSENVSITNSKILKYNNILSGPSWYKDDVLRWFLRMNDVESGSNSGSNIELIARSDAGANLGYVWESNRATRTTDFWEITRQGVPLVTESVFEDSLLIIRNNSQLYFQPRSNLITGQDLNLITSIGARSATGSTTSLTNAPTEYIGGMQAVLTVYTSGAYLVQEFYIRATGEKFTRTRDSGTTWTAWTKRWGSSDFSSTDLTEFGTAYDDKINSASYNNGTDLLTLNQQDGGTVTVTIPSDTVTPDIQAVMDEGSEFAVAKLVRLRTTGANDISIQSGGDLDIRSSGGSTYISGLDSVLIEAPYFENTSFNDVPITNDRQFTHKKYVDDAIAEAVTDSLLISQDTVQLVSSISLSTAHAGKLIVNNTTSNYTIDIGTSLNFKKGIQKIDFEPWNTGNIVLDCSAVTVKYRDAVGSVATVATTVTIIQGATLRQIGADTYMLIGSFTE